jgi:hypothetical protein
MTNKERQDRVVGEAEATASASPSSDPDLERLRLKFELELLRSQDAGAALDPLLRRRRQDSETES